MFVYHMVSFESQDRLSVVDVTRPFSSNDFAGESCQKPISLTEIEEVYNAKTLELYF